MNGLRHFFAANGWTIGRLTFEHLWLTMSAMLLAGAIGLPLGVLLARRQRLAGPVIAVANVIQVIPSLALFGLLLPVPWLGENAARLAILALTGYALLPILRNTYAGITSVDPALVDVANALGMTPWQRLRKVELPLAASVILAGVRTSTVTCVGVATIAAAIGAGGLGELIFRGWRAWTTGWCWRVRFQRLCWPWGRMRGWGFWRKSWRLSGYERGPMSG